MPRRLAGARSRPGLAGHTRNLSPVAEEHALGVWERGLLTINRESAVDLQDVEPAVVVEVEPAAKPKPLWPRLKRLSGLG
jgi:hypothetical protein